MTKRYVNVNLKTENCKNKTKLHTLRSVVFYRIVLTKIVTLHGTARLAALCEHVTNVVWPGVSLMRVGEVGWLQVGEWAFFSGRVPGKKLKLISVFKQSRPFI